MKRSIVTMFVVALLSFPVVAFGTTEKTAQDNVSIQEMDQEYLPLIEDARLLRSGCKIKEVDNKGPVLMAIGVIAVKPSKIPGQSLALAIAGAQANARAEMTRFLYGVENKTGTEVHNMLDVTTFTREEAEGFVKAAQQRGQWIAEDGSVLGVLMVYEPGASSLTDSIKNDMLGMNDPKVAQGKGVVEHIDADYDPDK